MRPLLATVCVTVLLAPASAGADWKRSAFPEWDADTIYKLLVDSPWARPKTIKLEWRKRDQKVSYRDIPGADHNPSQPIGSPVGGIGVNRNVLPHKADILVRWASALPVRQATGLFKLRDAKLPSSQLERQIPPAEAAYVWELFGVPAEIAHRGPESVEAVAVNSAQLVTRKGRALKATHAKATVQGETMTLRIFFPKTDPLTAADEEIDVEVDMQIFSLREKYKLASLLYQGNLEL